MSIFYKSLRIGKNGKEFWLWKFKTLKENSDKNEFADKHSYTWCGRFLRKTKLDELPALWNVIKGDMNIVGVRPMEKREVDLLPIEVKNILLSKKPGFTSLASIHFFDEEKILQLGDSLDTYWKKIKPMKIVLDIFYIQNWCFFLDYAIMYITVKKIIKSFFIKDAKRSLHKKN